MKNTTFLIETLKRTLNELAGMTLTNAEQAELTTMVTQDHFVKLFCVPEEEIIQLNERAFSELTEYKYNSLYAGLDLVGNHDWAVADDGGVVVRSSAFGGSNYYEPPRRILIFKLIDEGRDTLCEETRLLVARIEDTETKKVFSVNFEVFDADTGQQVFALIKRYLPERYKASIKKL